MSHITTMTITIERTPRTLQFDGATIDVEELSVRLPFARKPADITDMAATGDYVAISLDWADRPIAINSLSP